MNHRITAQVGGVKLSAVSATPEHLAKTLKYWKDAQVEETAEQVGDWATWTLHNSSQAYEVRTKKKKRATKQIINYQGQHWVVESVGYATVWLVNLTGTISVGKKEVGLE